MYFNATAYQLLLPVVLLLFVKNRTLAKNVLAVLNYGLLLYTVTLLSRIYHLVKFIRHFSPTTNYHYTIGFFEIRIILIVLISALFLVKKMETSITLSLGIFVLLWMNDYYFSFNVFSVDFLVKTLNYFSLMVALYAFLWLNHQLPSQRIKHV